MKTLLVIALLMWFTGLGLAAVTVGVEWDASVEPEVIGYHVLVGVAPKTYTATNTIVGRLNTNAAFQAVNRPVAPVYFAVVAFADDGRMSLPSAEVAWTNRIAIPKNVRVTTTITIP